MTDTPARAAPPPPPVAELVLFDQHCETHRLSRGRLEADGMAYRLLLAVPRTAPPRAGFPILYALDGNAFFDLMSAGQLASAEGLMLAGIAHDTDMRFDPPSRSRDYTPHGQSAVLRPDPARPDRLIGGADPFLDRLLGPIRRHTEAQAPVDPERRALFGHSLAGMLSLYALLTRPAAFSRLIAASPSIWWGGEAMLTLESATPPLGGRHDVLVALGDSERRSSATGPHWDGPAPHTLEMVRRLQKREGLDVSSCILPGLGHAATLPASIPLALAFAAERA